MDDDLGAACQVGTLAHDRGQIRFRYARDFLVGVQDLTRQGALRFRKPDTETFLGNEPLAAPLVTSLREMEAVAWQLSHRRLDDLDALRQWLAGDGEKSAHCTSGYRVDGRGVDLYDPLVKLTVGAQRATRASAPVMPGILGLFTGSPHHD